MSAAAPFPIDLLFRALADATRLRLLNLIADNEICVCYLVDVLRMSQPKISRHLAYLRGAGIVAARRQGRWMHYRLMMPTDPVAAAILKETLAHLRALPNSVQDLSKLERDCCSGTEASRRIAPPPRKLTTLPQSQ